MSFWGIVVRDAECEDCLNVYTVLQVFLNISQDWSLEGLRKAVESKLCKYFKRLGLGLESRGEWEKSSVELVAIGLRMGEKQ